MVRVSHGVRVAVRATAAAVSLALLMGSAWVWDTYRGLDSGLRRSSALDVLGSNAARSSHGDMNLLLIGLDSRRNMDGTPLTAAQLAPLNAGDGSDLGGYNTNTLLLIHIPGDGSRATAVSIPRDDYVQVPGYGMQKIKEAYGLAKADADSRLVKQGVQEPQREQESRDAGRRSTIATIENLLKVPIDHFAEVNLIGFYDIVQALGPVTVCLNHAVKDSYSGADFPAGVQTLDASQALAFVRQRHGLPNGDLDRTHRQQAFVAAVSHKLRTEGLLTDLGKLQALIGVTKKDVVIDNKLDPLTFAETATSLTSGNVDFYTLPIVRYATENGQSVNIVDPAALRAEVKALFTDHPKPAAKPAPAPKPTNAANETVDVYNGGNTQGLAATTSRQLVAEGFRAGTVDSVPTQTATRVTYGTGAAADAALIAGRYHVTASADSSLAAGHIRIDLGTSADPVIPPEGSQGGVIHPSGGIPCVN
ncbi:MAG: LytR family transcriptional regulator [Jatrophihabitans sp.]|nr:MAG: LytR family transcriptional regulator [Jatrophihabitans sp.]